ncbi:MAG: cytochrome c3 family protein [Proteobacteria bacterium]|nr:cytochrome c3 family protein [Pseudomonadota bacterium]MBU1715066.1 cytochrome c3 family protein [Pseudomonadota bacterium]
MKKNLLISVLAMAAVICTGLITLPVRAGNQLKAPDQEITIAGKKPVKFNHQVHLDLQMVCGTCHHDDEHQPLSAEEIGGLETAAKLQCASCHNPDFKITELQNRKTIFHARCRDCHKKGLAGKNGPTDCNGCHTRKTKKAVEGC